MNDVSFHLIQLKMTSTEFVSLLVCFTVEILRVFNELVHCSFIKDIDI